MSEVRRAVRRFSRLAPALVVIVTALFVLPHQAGGFRLAKWGAFGAALALSAASLLHSPPRQLPRGWWVLGLFVASALLLPALSAELSPTHWPTALGMVSGVALFFVTATALAGDAQEGERSARRVSLVVLVATGALCSLVVLLQAAGLDWLRSDTYTGLEFRAPGTFGNPNWAAAFLAPLVPLALGLAGTTEQPRWYYAGAAVVSIATVATLSKGGTLSLVAGAFAFVVLNRRVPLAWRIVLVTAASVSVLLGLSLAWHYDLLAQAPWLRGRLFLWHAALFIFGEHPLTGVGLGGYPAAYGDAAAALIDGGAAMFVPLSSVDFAHHDLLQFAAEGGAVTALTFVAVVVVALMVAHRRQDPLSWAVGAAVAALGVNGLSDSTLRVPSSFVLFFFLLGWLSSGSLMVPRASWQRWLRPLLVGVALLGGVQAVRFSAGNAAWTRGREALRVGSSAIGHLERARFWLPEHGRSASQYARALARAGRIDDALTASTHAASLRFDFDDEVFRRDLQSRGRDRDAKIQLWREFSARFPLLVTPQLRLGALYLQAGDRAAAITAFESVLANPQATPRAEKAREQARGVLRTVLARDVSPARPQRESSQ